MLAGDEGAHPITERPDLADILAEPDSTIAIDRFARYVAAANARAAGMWRALRSAADSDPKVRAEFSAQDARRRADLRFGAEWLVSRGLISPKRTDVAADVLGFLTAPDSYQYFVSESGWTLDQYERWLRRSIDALVRETSA